MFLNIIKVNFKFLFFMIKIFNFIFESIFESTFEFTFKTMIQLLLE